ncbi:hypothetical protein J7E81_22465 [Bacillus sp. ISL-18]|uniref:Imm32 family immunity protein n=1 Tax=Bacillus sp. ISL-18 TaxID=2819118 RepID=UPI001BECDC7D|nr:hypothetical protein [Bacillus sp. ISL-18]MBT2657966.1 hypothetical protein [Bacillus sp. ISL-18]
MENYTIKLNNNFDVEEGFELTGDNIAQVTVLDINGDDVTKQSRVQFTLSKNALLGLGTELIRLAHNYHNGKHSHIDPIYKGDAYQSMGIMLHPDSSELIICCGDYEPYTEYIEEDKK